MLNRGVNMIQTNKKQKISYLNSGQLIGEEVPFGTIICFDNIFIKNIFSYIVFSEHYQLVAALSSLLRGESPGPERSMLCYATDDLCIAIIE